MVLGFTIPRRFLRGSYQRVTLTVVALACGIALICALNLVNRAVLNAFVEIIDNMAGRASLQVSVEDSGLFPEVLADDVSAVPGVERAVAVVVATAFTTGAQAQSLTVQGLDLANPDAVRIYEPSADTGAMVADGLGFLNQPDSIILTTAFAAHLGVTEGGRLMLDTPNGRRTFTVRGLINPTGIGKAFGGNLALMDIGAAEIVFTRPGMINRIDVVVQRGADVAAVAERIRASVPRGLQVDTTAQRKADLHAVVRSLQLFLEAVGLVALAAAFLIAFNRLVAVFEERTWQLGVMRAIGVARRSMCLELIKESAVLGAMSVALGIPAGMMLGRAILPAIAATTALNFRTIAPATELVLGWWAIGEAAALGMGAALLAALLPAWRASGVSVAEVLRGRGIELVRPQRLGRGAVLAALAAAIVGALLLQRSRHDPLWGLAATGLAVVLTGAAAQPLLRLIREWVVPVIEPWIGPSGRFVSHSLTRNPRRTALATAMIGIGLGTVLWLALVAVSFEATAVRVFEQAMRADFVVSSSHIGAGALEMPIDDDLIRDLTRVDGVESAVGIRLANWQYEGGPVVLDAFDPDYFRNPEYGAWPLHGPHVTDAWNQVADGTAAVVSSNFSQNLGVRVGEIITLDTPNGALPLLVAGITTDFASPRGTIEMSRATYKRYWNDPRVTRFFVQTTRGSDRQAVRDRIAAALSAGDANWRIISSGELVAYWADQIRRAFASLYVLAGVILAVILFGIADNLSAGVSERTRNLGTLRAVGVSQGQLRRMVVLEALVIAALGLALALIEGLALAAIWTHTTIPYLLGWLIDLRLPVEVLLFVCIATLACCAVAAVIPGRRAARLQPAMALRCE